MSGRTHRQNSALRQLKARTILRLSGPSLFLRRDLEFEVRLQFDRSAAKYGSCPAKVRVGDGVDRSIEVELVEDIVGIGAQFQACAFPQHSHLGQAEALDAGDIGAEVAWSEEMLASNPGSGGECGGRRGCSVGRPVSSGRLRRNCEVVGGIGSGEVAARLFEGVGALGLDYVVQIGGWAIAAFAAGAGDGAGIVVNRIEGKSGKDVNDSAKGPTA